MPIISFTVDTTQAQRIAHAFGYHYTRGTDATPAEVKQYIINYVKTMVIDAEEAEARAALTPPPDVVAT